MSWCIGFMLNVGLILLVISHVALFSQRKNQLVVLRLILCIVIYPAILRIIFGGKG